MADQLPASVIERERRADLETARLMSLAKPPDATSPGQPGQPVPRVAPSPKRAPDTKRKPGQPGAARSLPGFEIVAGGGSLSPGVYWRDGDRDRDSEEDAAAPIWICSPLAVVANTRDSLGSEWGRLLEWDDRDGRRHRWAMPAEMLAGSGEELRAALLRDGLEITSSPTHRRRLLDYISWARPSVTARAVRHTGWHSDAFVFPTHTLGDDPIEPIHYQAATSEGVRLGQGGTIEGWRQRVAVPSAGNSRLVLAISASFAAPCLGLLGAEGGGVHLRGGSSAGKTGYFGP